MFNAFLRIAWKIYLKFFLVLMTHRTFPQITKIAQAFSVELWMLETQQQAKHYHPKFYRLSLALARHLHARSSFRRLADWSCSFPRTPPGDARSPLVVSKASSLTGLLSLMAMTTSFMLIIRGSVWLLL